MGQAEISQRSRLLPYFTACYPLSRAGAAPNPIQNNSGLPQKCRRQARSSTCTVDRSHLATLATKGIFRKCRKPGRCSPALARLVIAAIAIPGRARLQLSDGAVEGLPARPRIVSERLISLRHRPSTAAATPCPTLTAVATAPSPTAAARSSCSPALLTGRPRQSCSRMASPSRSSSR